MAIALATIVVGGALILYRGSPSPRRAVAVVTHSTIYTTSDSTAKFISAAQNYIKLNRYDSALVELREAVKRDPQSATLRVMEGKVAHVAGDDAEARKAIDEAEKLAPGILGRDDEARKIRGGTR